MGVLTAWAYPLRGVAFLARTPELWRIVARFLAGVAAASSCCTIAAFALGWRWHVALAASSGFGHGILARLVASLVLLAEASVPTVLLFQRRLERLQQRLFDMTLQLRGAQVSPLSPADRSRLAGLLAGARQHEAERAAAQKRSGGARRALTAALGLAVQLFLKPRASEPLLMRKARGVTTLLTGVLVPAMLPLTLWRDSSHEAASLLSGYFAKKGLKEPDAVELAVNQRLGDLRSFGMTAVLLGYVPLLNWLLALSNQVGAALLAADMEKKAAPLF